MKKYIILNEYFDIGLNRTILKNEILDLKPERVEQLKKVGIQVEEVEEEISKDEISLLDQYNEDRNIVDTLNVKDLKSLCKELDIKYTKEDEIREHLKTMEVLEDN